MQAEPLRLSRCATRLHKGEVVGAWTRAIVQARTKSASGRDAADFCFNICTFALVQCIDGVLQEAVPFRGIHLDTSVVNCWYGHGGMSCGRKAQINIHT